MARLPTTYLSVLMRLNQRRPQLYFTAKAIYERIKRDDFRREPEVHQAFREHVDSGLLESASIEDFGRFCRGYRVNTRRRSRIEKMLQEK